MNDWLRSLTVLAMAFVGIVVVTLALAAMIVPGPAVSSQATDDDSPGPSVAIGPQAVPGGSGIPGFGGDLTVTGDREGTFSIDNERYELATDTSVVMGGNDGRITIERDPLEVTRLSYDGLEFFTDPGDCTITAGNLDDALGIGFAELHCDQIEDVRGNGVISVSGEVGLPLDVLVGRTLPESGGSVTIGDETWEFESALLNAYPQGAIAGVTDYQMRLVDVEAEFDQDRPLSMLGFTYDTETHEISLATVRYDSTDGDVPPDACQIARVELGQHNPQTVVSELTIDCPEVEVPGLGPVPISGTVVIDEISRP